MLEKMSAILQQAAADIQIIIYAGVTALYGIEILTEKGGVAQEMISR